MQSEQIKDLLSNIAVANQTATGWDIFFIILINLSLLIVVKFIFDLIDIVDERNSHNLSFKLNQFINYSSIIGVVERFLYIIGFWITNATLITVVIAVKTIMRFTTVNAASKQWSKSTSHSKLTAEKYILGTLLNILLAIVIVWLFKY